MLFTPIYWTSSALILLIAAFVYSRNPRGKTNTVFLIFSIVIGSWIFSASLLFIYGTIFLSNLTTFLGFLMGSTFPVFIRYFPNSKESFLNKTNIFLIFYTFLAFLLIYLRLIVKGVVHVNGQLQPVLGIAYPYFVFTALLLSGYGFYLLIKKYRQSKGTEKEQLKYFFLGLSLFFLSSIFSNVISPLLNLSFLTVVGPAASVAFVGFTAYSIIARRLLDVRLVVARTLAYSLLIVTIAVFYVGSTILISNTLLRTSTNTAQLVVYAVLTLIVAFTFQPLRKFLEKSTDKIFFKQDYDSNQLLSSLTKIMAETILIDDIAHKLLYEITFQMRLARGSVVLTDAGRVFVTESQGFKENPVFSEKDVFSLQALDKNLIFEELEEGPAKELMRKLNVTVVIPLKTQVDHVGLLLLGEKSSGEIYSSKDIKVLEIFAPEAAISFENAKSVEKIRRFNITLKEQVDHATRELRNANEQLKDLDKLKDEFLSIASHDLRTPMTAIKGYLWMAINGRAGKIENQALKRYLDISYSSAERMIQLINDLLNVSRIKAGRVQMVFEEIDIKSIIDQVFAEIMSKVTEKSILLKYEGETNLPKLILDKQRFPEILQNLIGNAIKFTPEKGKITVTAKRSKEEGFVEIAVTDTGVGLSKEDAGKLFEKYGRIETSYAKAKESGGTGLGLYITKNYVDLHGGKIWVESEVGKGTSFIFTLHVADPELVKKMNTDTQKKQVAPSVPQTNNSTVKEMAISRTP